MKHFALLSVLLLCLLLIFAISTGAEQVTAGSCGENAFWELNSDGVLTISGSGSVDDYSVEYSTPVYAPWYEYADSIRTVVVESGITSLGSESFQGCGKLTTVVLANSVQVLKYRAFWECTALVEIRSNGLVKVESDCFGRCSCLKEISFPSTLTELQQGCFYRCTQLKKITFWGDAPAFSYYSFESVNAEVNYIPTTSGWTNAIVSYYDSNLTWKALTNAGKCGQNIAWVLDDDGLLTITGSGDMEDYYPTSPWSKLAVKRVVIDGGVTSIGCCAFANCTELSDISIPEGVTTINTRAFYSCSNLANISIPDSVTYMGDGNTFQYCYNLKSIIIPAGLKKIGTGMFYGCRNLTEITIPDSVTKIEAQAFYGCKNLNCVSIPEGVTDIGSEAFYECASLEDIHIPDTVRLINNSAFSRCTGLTNVNFGRNVYNIGPSAFSDCTGLESISFQYRNGVLIQYYAFYGCSALKDIRFYGDCPRILDKAFFGVTANVCYPNGNTTYQSFDSYGGTLTWIESQTYSGKCGSDLIWLLDDNGTLTISGTGEMYDLRNDDAPWYKKAGQIEQIVLNSGITSIAQYAFYGCQNVQTLTIPASVTTIAANTFPAAIRFEGDLPAMDSRALYGVEQCFYPCGNSSYVELGQYGSKITWEPLHEEVVDEEIEATCSVEGKTAGKHCAVCGTVTQEQLPTETAPHTAVTDERVEATCSANGLTEGSHCSVCNAVLQEQAIIFMLPHTYEVEKPVPATSSTDGKCGGISCKDCGKVLTRPTLVRSSSLLEFPEQLSEIDAEAFVGVAAQQITIPNGVTRIEARAFAQCYRLKIVIIPSSVQYIADDAFEDCENLYFICSTTSPCYSVLCELGTVFEPHISDASAA